MTQTRSEFLKTELNQLIDKFQADSTRHKKMFRRFRYVVFTLTALSTILAALGTHFDLNPEAEGHEFSIAFNLIIVALTASIGVVTSLEGLHKPDELWIIERNTYHALRDVRRALGFRSAAPDEKRPEEAATQGLFRSMQSILESAGAKWRAEQADASEGSDAPTSSN